MLGLLPFVLMFITTSIAMVRERTSGTLERLLTTPLGKLDLSPATVRRSLSPRPCRPSSRVHVAFWVLDLDIAGNRCGWW